MPLFRRSRKPQAPAAVAAAATLVVVVVWDPTSRSYLQIETHV